MKWVATFTVIIMISSLCVPVSAWTTGLSLLSENRSINLVIGSDNNATDEFDAGYDIPLPPPPPSSSFDAYLMSGGLFDMLQKDIRKNQTWTIYTRSKGTIDLTWDNAPVALRMGIGETSFFLNHSGTYTIKPGEYRITIQGFADSLSITNTSGQMPISARETGVLAVNDAVTPSAGSPGTLPTGDLQEPQVMISMTNPIEQANEQKNIPSGSASVVPSASQDSSIVQSNPETTVPAPLTTTPNLKSPGFEIGITITGIGIWMMRQKKWRK